MRIAYLAAGAAGMYCGACLRDNTLAAALKALGHEVCLIPTYTPLRTDEEDVSIGQVFYGAINVYLQQQTALFRHSPRALDRFLDGKWVLGLASRLAGSTDASSLGELTLSVLQGEEGHQRKELERLTSWLRDELRPDLVHVSNSLMLGMASAARRELGVPLVCSLQGEDLFIDSLTEPWRDQVLGVLRQRAEEVDRFVVTSQYYADHMAGLLAVGRDRVSVVRPGIRLQGHGAGARPGPTDDSFVIGYLARLCPDKGLHNLFEAFTRLAERVGPERVRLGVCGYLGAGDRQFVADLEQRMADRGLSDRVDMVGEVDRVAKIRFLNSIDVLSVPTVYPESKGLYLLEALANGVPVVMPAHGIFPEIVEATGGGCLVEPGSPEALADGLERLMDDPALRQSLGRSGQEAVTASFSDRHMAEATLAVYTGLLTEEV